MSGAVGVWHFDEASGNAVNSVSATGAALNATLNGGITYALGKFSNSATVPFPVNSANYYQVANNAALNFTTGLTMACWVKPDGIGGGGASGTLLAKSGNWYLEFGYNAGYYVIANVSGISGISVDSGPKINDTNWHHIAFTYDPVASKTYFYRDGVLSDSDNVTGTMTTGANPIYFGRNAAGSTLYGGGLDDVAIFSRALSVTEIAALASSNPSYPWTVPSISASNQMKIQAASASVPNFTDASDNNFTATDINITSPNTAITWKAASTENITWNALNFVPDDLTLEYSRDGGTNWLALTPAANNLNHTSGTPYAWTVPSATADILTTVKVRARSAAGGSAELNDASDVDFTIADLNVSNPSASGIYWKVGTAQTISWIPAGVVPNDLTIEYAADGSTFSNTIATSVNGGGNAVGSEAIPQNFNGAIGVWRFNEGSGTAANDSASSPHNATLTNAALWTNSGKFGAALSSDGTNTVSVAHNSVFDFGTGAFSLSLWVNKATANVSTDTYIYKAAGDQTIGDAQGFHLYNSGAPKFEIGDDGSGGDILNFPSIVGSGWRHLAVVVTATQLTGYLDGSVVAGPIARTQGSVNNASPIRFFRNGGGGTFSNEGKMDDVALFSRDLSASEVKVLAGGGYTYTPVIGDVTASASTAKIRIKSVGASTNKLTDISNAGFQTYQLDITSPNTNVSWPSGSTQNITWTQTGLPGTTVKLLLSTDGGATYPDTIATGIAKAAGTYAWIVNGDKFGTQTRVKIVDESQALVEDASDTNFTINGHTINVTNPALNEVVGISTQKKINWNITGDAVPGNAKVMIEYSSDNWPNDDTVNKVWTLIDSGIAFDNVEAGGCDPGQYCYNWAVSPSAASNTVTIRVSDSAAWNTLGGQNAKNGHSAVFRVTGTTAVIKPNGGEKWAYGVPHTISYQTQGTMPTVKLSYASSADGYTSWTTITSSTNNTGSYDWTPARNEANAALKIKIEKSDDAAVYDISDASFSVTGVTVTAPDAASRVKANDPYTINWTQTALTNVKLEYTLDGTNYISITPSMSAAAGTLAWTLPLNTAANFKVRITDADAVPLANGADTALSTDTSDAVSVIYGQIIVTAPNGSEDWSASNPHDITWTVNPSGANVVRNVKIFYTTTGFGSENIEIDPLVAKVSNNNPGNATGKYTWVPTFTSGTVKVRVVDADDPAVATGAAAPSAGQNQDDSNAFFQLTGISMTAPAVSAVYTVGGNHPITFGFTGTITNVKLEYSSDGGSNWNTIQANQAVSSQPFTYNWNPVPDAISTNTVVKVTQCNSDGSIPGSPKTAISPAFTVTGALSTATPATQLVGDVLTIGDQTTAATLKFTRTGTMSAVKIEFSASGNFSGDEVTVSNTAPGSLVNWTIPDAVGNAGKLRVTDMSSNHPVTVATSNAFSIKGSFTFSAPVGSTEWAVDDSKAVTWTNNGTMSTAKLEYATDADGYTAWTQIFSGANSATAPWNNIPDLVVLNANNPNPPTPLNSPTNGKRNVKFRLTDTAHSGAAQATLESAVFKVKYYLVTFNVTNNDGNNLSSLSAIDSQTWNVTDNTLTSPTQTKRHYKYSTTETATFSKTGFTATTATFASDADKTVNVFLESETPLPFNVNLFANYNAPTNMLNLSATLSKSGAAVTTAPPLGTSSVTIYDTDGTTVLATLATPADGTGPDANGVYKYTAFNPATKGMTSGNSYTAKVTIIYSGVSKTAISIINFTTESEIQKVSTAIGASTDAAGAATVFGTLNQQTATLGTVSTNVAAAKSSADAAKASADAVSANMGAINDAAGTNSLFGKLADVKVSMGTSPTGKTVLQSLSDIQDAGLKKGKAVARSSQAAQGSSVDIGFQTDSGLAPTADIYDANNNLIASNVGLKEVGNTGVYKYRWDVNKQLAAGDYTVVMKEATNGSVESMQVSVGSAQTSSTGDTGALMGPVNDASAYSQKSYEAAKKIQDNLSKMMDRLNDNAALNKARVLQSGGTSVSATSSMPATLSPSVAAEAQQSIGLAQSQAEELAKALGVDFKKMMELTENADENDKEQGDQMKKMTNQVERTKKLIEALMKSMGSNGEVVVEQWMEKGN